MTGLRIALVRMILVLGVLSACAPRGAFETAIPLPAATPYDVLLVTDRAPAATGLGFATERSATLSYLDLTVASPPVHRAGEIEYPRRPADPDRAFAVTRAKWKTASALARLDGPARRPCCSMCMDTTRRQPKPSIGRYRCDTTSASTARLSHSHGALPKVRLAMFTTATVSPIARDHLERLLRDLADRQDRDIQIVAHSMGAMLVMETLRQMRMSGRSLDGRIAGLVFLSPDIDIRLFRSQFAQAAPMPSPFVIFVSQNDRALRVSSRLSGQQPRLGAPEDIIALQEAGLIVIDLTNARGGEAGGHFKVATSPDAIALIRGLQQLGVDFDDASPSEAGAILASVTAALGLK